MPGLEPLLVQQWRTRAQALRQALERLRPPEQTERAARSPGGGPVEVATEVFVQAAKRARAAFERLRPLFEAGAHVLAQRLTAALQGELSTARAEILGPAAAGQR
jgi:ribosomal protein S7